MFSQSSKSTKSKGKLTTDQKKMKANRLAKLQKLSRCNNSSKRGHFANECLPVYNSIGSDSPLESRVKHHRKTKRIMEPPKRSHANVIKNIVRNSFDNNNFSSISSEGYVTSTSLCDDMIWIADSWATKHMTDKKH